MQRLEHLCSLTRLILNTLLFHPGVHFQSRGLDTTAIHNGEIQLPKSSAPFWKFMLPSDLSLILDCGYIKHKCNCLCLDSIPG